jgi:hypothetical protein
MSNKDIVQFFEYQRKSPESSPELIELLELALKSQNLSSDPGVMAREKVLLLKLVTSSVHQFFLEIDGKPVFDFGIEIKKKSELLEYYEAHSKIHKQKARTGEIEIRRIFDFLAKNVPFHCYTVNYDEMNHNLFAIFLFPSSVLNANSRIKDCMEVIRNAFLFAPKPKTPQILPIFSEFKSHLLNKIQNHHYRSEQINGVIAHFLIEDLALYSKYMGEQFTAFIFQEVGNTIRKYLKKNDFLYNCSRRSFITFLPDCDVETVERRFRDVFFKIDPLIIKYQLEFHAVTNISLDSDEFWDRIFTEDSHSMIRM